MAAQYNRRIAHTGLSSTGSGRYTGGAVRRQTKRDTLLETFSSDFHHALSEEIADSLRLKKCLTDADDVHPYEELKSVLNQGAPSMPIPQQQQFILPFLQILGDGEQHTRRDIMAQLVQRFGITPSEEKQMSGAYPTVRNRIAWCDVYFVKSGFVRKELNRRDPLQDVFQITELGQRELNQRPHQITIAHLQTFWNP